MFAILAGLGLGIIALGEPTVLLAIYSVLWVTMIFLSIKNSANRWKALGLASAAFLFVCGLGVLAAFILIPSQGSIIDINEVIDKVRTAVEVGAPLAAIAATGAIPVRKSK